MPKLFTTLFTILLFTFSAFAQDPAAFNMVKVGQLTYNDGVNDIWGYTAPDGTEYALVGLRNGVSIVSLADPSNPTEVANLGGPNSLWRDLKTFGDYAYITNETGDGVLIVDMTDLPGSVQSYYFTPTLDLGMEIGTLTTAHNLYIDEKGYCYLVGGNLNSGGALIFDLNPDPYNPTYVGKAIPNYSHDVYVRGDTMWTSDVYDGFFSVFNVTDRTNPVLLATQTTPFFFTHNAWISDDGNSLFTTDEQANAPVASYDVSDLSDIQLLDEYRPSATVGLGVIPHNVHVKNDFLVISYYTDGVVVVDANRPQNLVEVGIYDTFIGPDGGFNGCWGAYPFLPSGLILGSDQSNGLFVLSSPYQRACYLEGVVTDANDGQPINDATITIIGANVTDATDLFGDYKTGYADAGTYDVQYSRPGYITQVIPTTLVNGQVVIQDVALETAVSFIFLGSVVDAETGEAIPNAPITLISEDFNYQAVTNGVGNFGLTMFGDLFTVTSGAWGYETVQMVNMPIDQNTDNLVISLNPRIVDPFEVNLGWTVTGDAETGAWVRDEPIGTSFGGAPSNTEFDINNDVGVQCYVTGNAGGGGGTDDVDNGITTLTSPEFDLSTMNEPYVAYNLWFVNGGGNGSPDDALEVRLSNGIEEVVIETVTESNGFWRPRSEIRVEDFILPTSEMRIIFETSDFEGSGHIVEAAVDFFEAFDNDPITTSVSELLTNGLAFEIFPSPFQENTQVRFDLSNTEATNASIRIVDLTGRLVASYQLPTEKGNIRIGDRLQSGVYFVQMETEIGNSEAVKIVKIR